MQPLRRFPGLRSLVSGGNFNLRRVKRCIFCERQLPADLQHRLVRPRDQEG